MVKEKDLEALWEEMGASTGAFIGRFIGLNAKLGLQVLDSVFSQPLEAMTPKGHDAPPEESDTKEETPAQGNAGIRTEVWQQMGYQYGTKMGEITGMGMDMLIQSLNQGIIEPLNNVVKQTAKNNTFTETNPSNSSGN